MNMRAARHFHVAKVLVLFLSASACLAQTAASSSRLPVPVESANGFGCAHQSCAMPSHGSYPHLIIGRFVTKASAARAKSLFLAMRSQRKWLSLPSSPDAFYAALQPVAIQVTGGRVLAVLMAQEEAGVERPEAGDLVRYSPHRGKYEIPPVDPVERSYWAIDGCVSVICRAKDKACFTRYPAGVYRVADGLQISPQTFKPLPGGTLIDTESLLPRQAQGSAI